MPELTPAAVALAADVLLASLAISLAVRRQRGVAGTLAWVFAVLAFPFLGSLAYFALAHPHFGRTVRRRRLSAERLRAHLAGLLSARGCTVPEEASVLELAGRVTGLPPTADNRVELLVDNAAAFERKAAAIGSARRSVWAEYYIVKDDETGAAFLSALTDRARDGLDVRLLYDAVGSSSIPATALAALREAGGRAEAFLPINPLRRRWSIHLRNHRKLLVVDGATAFTGGMNVGDEYSGYRFRRGRRPWRDTHVAVTGPAASALARVFAEDWTFTTGEHPGRDRKAIHEAVHQDVPGQGALVAVLPSAPGDRMNASALAWFSGIANSRRRCFVSSPYFVPDEPTLRALVSAALRGVDVRLLVPARSDVPLAALAAASFFPELLLAGVRVFEYEPSVLHAKTLTVDGLWSIVGSANVDVRSFGLNFELGVLVFDRDVARQVEERFLADLADSGEVTLRSWYGKGRLFRAKTGLARLLAPLL